MKDDEYLRDFFAALALDGIMSKTASTTMPSGTRDQLARLAYQMADAMLEARDKPKSQSQPQDEGFPHYDKSLKRWDEQ
jgi:hypothetical protein